MKYLGFIKEHNDIECAKRFSDSMNSTSQLNPTDLQLIIEYLNKGEILLGWMGYFMDIDTKELIAPDSYFTDGVWIWPSYLPYYLNKYPNLSIEDDFIAYAKEKNFELRIDDTFKEMKIATEKQLAVILSGATVI